MRNSRESSQGLVAGLAAIGLGIGLLAIAVAKSPQTKRSKSGDRDKAASLMDVLRKRRPPRRKPPDAGVSESAVPPTGPFPKQGGAAVPLDFES